MRRLLPSMLTAASPAPTPEVVVIVGVARFYFNDVIGK
jgi:hypothetical protein